MNISVADAEGQLRELVRLAGQGEEIVLMQDGFPAVRLQPVRPLLTREEKKAFFDQLQDDIRKKNLPPGTDAARSQDFLYDPETGLPA